MPIVPFVLILLGLAFVGPPVAILVWAGISFGPPHGIDLATPTPIEIEMAAIAVIGVTLIALGVYRIVRPGTYPQNSN